MSVWVAYFVDRALRTLAELRRTAQRPPPSSRLFLCDKDYSLRGIVGFAGVMVKPPSCSQLRLRLPPLSLHLVGGWEDAGLGAAQ